MKLVFERDRRGDAEKSRFRAESCPSGNVQKAPGSHLMSVNTQLTMEGTGRNEI